MKRTVLLVICVMACVHGRLWVDAAETPKERFDFARDHLLKGRYGEALEELDSLAKEKPDGVDSLELVKVRCETLMATGDREGAEKILNEAILTNQDSADLYGWLARVHFERGRLDEADAAIAKSLKIDNNHLQARLIQAHVWTERGNIEKADVGYRWFVRYYNGRQPTDPDPLLFVGEGASQYARWHSVSQIFDFCVNTVAKDALKANKQYWPAHQLAGRLLLEKYNRQQGIPELKAALAINPNAVDVHVLLAQSAVGEYNWDEVEDEAKRALEVAPKTPGALRALAEAKLYFRDTDAAEKLLIEAMEINPIDQETLALMATLRMLQDGWPEIARLKVLVDNLDRMADLKDGELDQLLSDARTKVKPESTKTQEPKDSKKAPSSNPVQQPSESKNESPKGAPAGEDKAIQKVTRFEQIVIDVARRNSKPGTFLTALGEQADRFRQHTIAEALFKQATILMPQLSQPKTALGQVYMQTGRMDDAKRVFEDAFKADPYHVRVSNMRKVLKVLDDYSTVTTEHFVIRADAKLDKLLARYLGEYLEEVYPELTELFGYEPPGRTQIEIYNEAKGLSGHQWFSARMVGLPWVQTIGASTGSIIAMTSPTAMEQPLNWARVMKHEFVHVLTLQQTNFNIPHWYTEALAVRSEGYPRPVEWNKLLLERVPKGDLKNLDNLSMGFIRAGNQANWNFAYCQSVLYAEYMAERFGEPSLAKLLDAYRQNRTTDQAVPEVFGVTKSDFEKGYREYLDRLVAGLKQTEADSEIKPSQIEKAYEKNKSDPTAAAEYARLLLLIKKREEARKIADEVLKKEPTQPIAAMVVGALLLREDKPDEAAAVLQPALNQEHPNRHLLELLLRVRLKQKQADEALKLCDLGQQHFPYNTDWWKGRAAAAKLLGDAAKRREALLQLVTLEADDAAPRKALAEMALADQKFDEAYKFAKLTLHIDVLDADVHRLLGESLRGLNQHSRSITEFETALELKPKDSELQLGLAESLWLADRKDEALKTVEAVLKQKPDDDNAKRLRDKFTNKDSTR